MCIVSSTDCSILTPNRTILELKFGYVPYIVDTDHSSPNRTILELKYISGIVLVIANPSPNRTILELK